MKRRIARHKRTLALLLTLCLLLTCLPLQAMSADGTAEETDISNEVYIVDEDITKRGEYEKHFLCSDGTYRAVRAMPSPSITTIPLPALGRTTTLPLR